MTEEEFNNLPVESFEQLYAELDLRPSAGSNHVVDGKCCMMGVLEQYGCRLNWDWGYAAIAFDGAVKKPSNKKGREVRRYLMSLGWDGC